MNTVGKWTTILAVLPVACGTNAATPQLVDARRTYELASRGEAATRTPAKLLEAQQALERAEAVHQDDPGSEEERHFAYLAQRRAELAMAESDWLASQQALGSIAKSEELMTQRGLKNAQDQLRHQTGQIKDLRAKEQQLNNSKAALTGELEAERKARLKAEETARAALQSLNEIAKVKEEANTMTITLSGAVLFTTGKSTLLPIAQDSLKRVAEALKLQSQERSIVVAGHTDSQGSEESNQQLSLARAQAVRDYLVSQGVDANRISAEGRGESQPTADNATAEGRANNRRVEIIVGGGPTAEKDAQPQERTLPKNTGHEPATNRKGPAQH
ncbi:MAG: OmpA family protein [Polyangiaceae bacterium]|nr:OmpA family protein [Polyangiaceae bacterium]